jgi:UDP-glucose 4-epimerase
VKNYSFAVTVTGAAGFVGSHLVRHFLESDYEVKVMATDFVEEPERIMEFVHHEDMTYECYDIHQPLHSDFLAVDTFYHLAGIANPQVYLDDPLKVMDLNLDGLRNVLERVVRWSDHRPRIVYTSTSEVYGKNSAVPFDEEETDLVMGPTQKPRWCYAATKMVGEHYLRAYEKKGIAHTIFRLFNAVGDDVDSLGKGRVLSTMVGDGLGDGCITVVAPGTQTRCFTHIDDVVNLMARPTIFKKHPPLGRQLFTPTSSQTVNAGNNDEVDMRSLAKLVAIVIEERIGHRPDIVVKQASEVFGEGYDDMMRRVPAIERAERIFGWKAKISTIEIIDRYVDNALKETGWTGHTKTSA